MSQGSNNTAHSFPLNDLADSTGQPSAEHYPTPEAPVFQSTSRARLRSVKYVRFSRHAPKVPAPEAIQSALKTAEQPEVKAQRTQAIVRQVLKEKLASRSVPQSVLVLLQESWLPVMIAAYQQNDGGQQWRRSIAIIDELLWCLQSHTATEDRRRWIKIVPVILKKIRQDLEKAGFSSTLVDRQVKELKQELSRTFRQQSISAAEQNLQYSDVVPNPLAPRNKTAVERLEELEIKAHRECTALISSLTPGDLLEFLQVDGKVSRYRLHSRGGAGSFYIFTSRLGLKSFSKSQKELVHAMQRGRLRIIERSSSNQKLSDEAMTQTT